MFQPQNSSRYRVIEQAVPNHADISAQMLGSPWMGKHPISYGDPRVRGFMMEFADNAAHFQQLQEDAPDLSSVFQRFRDDTCNLFTLAVNQYPPTDSESFLMKPHIDRRYGSASFDPHVLPRSTMVGFLAFPASGRGGELVVLPEPGIQSANSSIPREGARAWVAQHRGHLIEPRPGRACVLIGALPHAVIGYEGNSGDGWRMVWVLAQFLVPSDVARATPYRRLSAAESSR